MRWGHRRMRRAVLGGLCAFVLAYVVIAAVGLVFHRGNTHPPRDGITDGPLIALGILILGGLIGWFAPERRK